MRRGAPGRVGLVFGLAIGLAVGALSAPASAVAHPGRPPEPHDLWHAWSFEPTVLLGLGLVALLYRRGLNSLWARAGTGRGVARWQAWAFTAGLLCTLAALCSPLDRLGNALFSAHMVQHLALVLLSGPLLAAGAPLLVFIWALPRQTRRRIRSAWRGMAAARGGARVLLHPIAAWALHAAALWVWHLPVTYDAAVRDDGVHALEHFSFLATAILFWWVVLPRGGALRRAPGLGMLYVFVFALQSGVLGALLTLGDVAWYTAHAGTTSAWGLTPLGDQQLAGVIMWVPGGVAYLAAIGWLLLRLLGEAERRRLRRTGLMEVGSAG
jgi:putative membrane protein